MTVLGSFPSKNHGMRIMICCSDDIIILVFQKTSHFTSWQGLSKSRISNWPVPHVNGHLYLLSVISVIIVPV